MLRILLSGPALLGVAVVGCGVLSSGCVLDRTGQSASEIYRRELALHGARLTNLEDEIDEAAERVGNLEQLNRARGQQEILKMESLDQVRGEVYRLRGEMEELRFSYDKSSSKGTSYQQDAAFRLAWLEARADQLEGKLELSPPPPPEVEGGDLPTDQGAPSGSGETDAAAQPADPGVGAVAAAGAPETDDPDTLITLAEQQLAQGDESGAEATLDRFLSLHSDHKRAAEARYRRAEASYNDKQYAQAVLRFQEVIDKHKASQWAAWAMLRQGESFDAQGQPDNARLFYEDVVRYWPKSKAANEARRKMK
jgi:tol-pal system protein YbgF